MTVRRVVTRVRALGVAVATVVCLVRPAQAQEPTLVPLWDPAYGMLEHLERLGLVELSGQRPYSRGRIRALLTEARVRAAAATGMSLAARSDAEVTIDRVGAGLDVRRVQGSVRGELGGGRSPGRAVPENGVGDVDAVINPLWAGRDGAPFGDRLTAGVTLEGDVSLGRTWGVQAAVRGSHASNSGLPLGDNGLSVERALLRATWGSIGFAVGRGSTEWGPAGGPAPLLSRNGPPLDAVRIGSDVPLDLAFVGRVDFSLFLADLGPRQNYPHAKLFGVGVEVLPAPGLRVGLAVVNKQGGEGAPTASLGDRLRDLSILWALLKGDDADRFSDKRAAIDVSVGAGSPVRLDVAVALDDFDRDRFGDVLHAASTLAAGVTLPRLGATGRHSVSVRGVRTGALVARHHQFTSGATLDGRFTGSHPGPDANNLSLTYAYEAVPHGWRAVAELATTRYGSDLYRAEPGPPKDIVVAADGPEERRRRLSVRLARHRGPVGGEVVLGVERVRDFGFVRGTTSENARISVLVWWRW